jgi:hypothetical protein
VALVVTEKDITGSKICASRFWVRSQTGDPGIEIDWIFGACSCLYVKEGVQDGVYLWAAHFLIEIIVGSFVSVFWIREPCLARSAVIRPCLANWYFRKHVQSPSVFYTFQVLEFSYDKYGRAVTSIQWVWSILAAWSPIYSNYKWICQWQNWSKSKVMNAAVISILCAVGTFGSAHFGLDLRRWQMCLSAAAHLNSLLDTVTLLQIQMCLRSNFNNCDRLTLYQNNLTIRVINVKVLITSVTFVSGEPLQITNHAATLPGCSLSSTVTYCTSINRSHDNCCGTEFYLFPEIRSPSAELA